MIQIDTKSPTQLAEFQWALYYLVQQRGSLGTSPVLPEHIESPVVRRWYQAALKQPDQYTYADLGISVDDLARIEELGYPPDATVKRGETRIQEEWCLRRARVAIGTAFDSVRKATPSELPGHISELQAALSECLAGRPALARDHQQVGYETIEHWLTEARATGPLTLPLPWPRLHQHTHGLPRRKLVVVGARSSEHKTTVARSIAAHVANSGLRVLYWTMEDDARDLAARTIAADTPQLHVRALTTGGWPKGKLRPTKDEMHAIMANVQKSLEGKAGKNLLYLDIPSPTSSQLYQTASAVHAKTPIDLFVFDFWQLVAPDGRERVDQLWWRREVAKAAAFAKRTNAAVIFTSQVEKTGSKESIEQGRVPRSIEMPFGSILRDGCYGCLMLGTQKRKDGSKYLRCQIDKWKGAENGLGVAFNINAPHDTLTEMKNGQ